MRWWRRLRSASGRLIERILLPALPFSAFDRPIFIIAAPRSGSTLLFDCLGTFSELAYLPHEADDIWWRLFPYAEHGNSDFVPASAASGAARRELRRYLFTAAARHHLGTLSVRRHLGMRPLRYLDKTIANCFHLEVLRPAFPDARFVLLTRHPRETVSSMIEGWPHLERFGKPQLSEALAELPAARIEHWTYPAPPGWTKVAHRPLAEICAWSWERHMSFALDGLEGLPPDRLMRVRYEDLLADTPAVVEDLAGRLDLRMTAEVRAFCEQPPLSHTTVSAPAPEKWRQHAAEIDRALPRVRKTARRVGYEV